MNIINQVSMVSALGLLLTACGGGSDGSYSSSNSGSGTNMNTSSISITGANAVSVSGETLSTAFDVDEITAGNENFVGVVVETPLNGFDISDYVSSRLVTGGVLLSVGAAGNAATGVVIDSFTQDCLVAGSLTISGEVQDETGASISAGDNFTLQFNGCSDDDGIILDGTFSMSFTSVTGDSSQLPFSFAVTVELGSFSVASGGETVVSNGSMFIENSTDATSLTTSLTGSALSISGSSYSVSLSNFDIDEMLNTNTTAYVRDASGSLTSSVFNGAVDFFTEASFTGIGDNNPDAGQMLITGANNSTVRITVVDNVNVTLNVDSDGDGTVDQTIQTTWDELDNQ